MMLGKRGRRPPMKRTTSMTEFTWDLNGGAAAESGHVVYHQPLLDLNIPYNGGGSDQKHVSSAHQRRNSAAEVVVESGNFLRACSLCNRRLIPGRDIFMYRGDSGFCSVECREKQMSEDERKEKYSVAASKMEAAAATAMRVSAV